MLILLFCISEVDVVEDEQENVVILDDIMIICGKWKMTNQTPKVVFLSFEGGTIRI